MKDKLKNNKNTLAKSPFDVLAWLAIVFLLVASIAANHYYHAVAWALRAAIGLVVVGLVLLVVFRTTQGRAAKGFIEAARSELRKVVWPTRQEASQVTFLVVAVVILTVFILWGVDSTLMWTVSWLTAQAG